MKQELLATLMPLAISGTLSTAGAELVAIILSIGIVITLIGWVTGRFWFAPYLDYRQKMRGKRNTIKPTRSNI